jgi:two-component system sensor histidine kinase VicK
MGKRFRLARSLQWKFVTVYLLLILFSMQLIGFYFYRALNTYFLRGFTDNLAAQGTLLAGLVARYMQAGTDIPGPDRVDIDNLTSSFGQITEAQVDVLNRDGVVISSSAGRAMVGQKREEPEIVKALSGVADETVRPMPQTGQRYFYLAVPIRSGNTVIGTVYIMASMQKIYATLNTIHWIFYTGIFIALILTGLLGAILSRTVIKPIQEITKKAKAMAGGNFNLEVKVTSDDEIGELGNAFNHLRLQLREALKANEREREKLEAILLRMGDGVLAVSPAGTVILANPAAAAMLGEDIDRLMGQNIGVLMDKAGAFVSNQSPEQTGNSLEYLMEGRDGAVLKAYVRAFHPTEEDDLGFVVVLHDITEEEQLEKARREFVANVSHEIRTPLTTVKSYIEALLDGAIHDREVAARFLSVIYHETERMARLVTDLLQLSRMDEGEESWRFSVLDVAPLVGEIVERYMIQCRKQEIRLTFSADPGMFWVQGDKDKLYQVFDNILSNAVKYTSPGGTIDVAVRVEGARVVTEVKDSGIGIPSEDLPHIFERFYRVDKARSRKMGGTGLGLSIAKEIIQHHQGQIDIESEMERGTTVIVSLPAVDGNEVAS